MKILQVCAYAAPYEGNFIKSLLTLQNRLRSENYEMIFAFPESIAKHPWCQSLAEHNTVYFLPFAHYKEKAKERGSFFSRTETVRAVEEMLDNI